MPCIQTKVTTSLSDEQKTVLKEKLGKAIELIPGKSEDWLMLTFDDNASIYFRGVDGNEAPLAWVQVSIYGTAEKEDFSRLTGAICTILESVAAIPSSNVFVKYDEIPNWGWNGNNF